MMNEGGGVPGLDRDALEDPGARGAVARFLDACAREDESAARAVLTAGSQDGFNIHAGPTGDISARLGEEAEDGDFRLVPVTLGADGEEQEMPFLVREEEGEWRVDMSATMERVMGFDPEDLVESMGQAMAGGMEAMGEALAGGFQAMGDAMSSAFSGGGDDEAGADAAEAIAEAEWALPIDMAPTAAMDALALLQKLALYYDPPFAPGDDEIDRTANSEDGGTSLYARYGTDSAGFLVQETAAGDHYLTVNVTTYGMDRGQDLSRNLVRMQDAGEITYAEAVVKLSGPRTARRLAGAFLAGRFGIDDLA